MSKCYWLINDFSGGEVTKGDGLHAANEHAQVDGFLVRKGKLEVPRVSTACMGTMPAISGLDQYPNSMNRFYKTGHAVQGTSSTNQTKWGVVKRDDKLIYLETKGVTTAGAATSAVGGWRPINLSGTSGRESFAEYNSKLYFTNSVDGMRRFDGEFYCAGSAICGGTALVRGRGTLWTDAVGASAIKYGDVVFFATAGANSTWVAGAGSYRVKQALTQTHIQLTGNGPSLATARQYMIARCHTAGFATPPTPSAAQSATAGSVGAGNYLYVVALKNSRTTYQSNQSENSANVIAVGATTSLRVTVTDNDTQADKALIYRDAVNVGAAPYYFATAINRNADGTWPTFNDKLTNTAVIVNAQAPTDHDRAPLFGHILKANDQIHGWGLANGRRYFSTINSPEYFPAYAFGIDDPSGTDHTVGGWSQDGDYGDDVQAVVIEGGAYAQSGNVGPSLLVFTKTKAIRWFGQTWLDYARVPAFGEGCLSPRSAVNCGGRIFWLGSQGILSIMSGSNEVDRLYRQHERLFNKDVFDRTDKTSAQAVYWNGYYVLTMPWSSVVGSDPCGFWIMTWVDLNTSALTVMSNHRFTGYDPADTFRGRSVTWLEPLDGPGDDGSLAMLEYYRQGVWKWDQAEAYDTRAYRYIYTNYRTPWLTFADDPHEIHRPKTLSRIIVALRQYVTGTENNSPTYSAMTPAFDAYLFTDGTNDYSLLGSGSGRYLDYAAWSQYSGAALTGGVTFSASGKGTKGIKYAIMHPNVTGRSFCFDMRSVRIPPGSQIVWLQFEYTVESNELEGVKLN